MITYLFNQWGRLVDRVRTGTWCQHTGRWGPWHLVDLGREKVRYCDRCGWMQTTNHPWRGLLRSRRTRRAIRKHGPAGEQWDSSGLDDDRMDAARRAIAEIKKRTTTEGELP